MSFRAEKILSWWILSSFLNILVQATCAGLNSLFSELNTSHSFSTTWKTMARKRHQNYRLVSLSLALWSSSSIRLWTWKDCFSQLKETLSFHARRGGSEWIFMLKFICQVFIQYSSRSLLPLFLKKKNETWQKLSLVCY